MSEFPKPRPHKDEIDRLLESLNEPVKDIITLETPNEFLEILDRLKTSNKVHLSSGTLLSNQNEFDELLKPEKHSTLEDPYIHEEKPKRNHESFEQILLDMEQDRLTTERETLARLKSENEIKIRKNAELEEFRKEHDNEILAEGFRSAMIHFEKLPRDIKQYINNHYSELFTKKLIKTTVDLENINRLDNAKLADIFLEIADAFPNYTWM
jgi:DNA repair ATPase RecN